MQAVVTLRRRDVETIIPFRHGVSHLAPPHALLSPLPWQLEMREASLVSGELLIRHLLRGKLRVRAIHGNRLGRHLGGLRSRFLLRKLFLLICHPITDKFKISNYQ